MRGRVILTHGRSLQALAAARSLGQRGIEVIGCDTMPLTVLSFSRYVRETFLYPALGEVGEEAFIRELAVKCRQYRPSDGAPFVLMPVHRDTRLIARYRDHFEPWIRVAAPSIESIDRVYPKHRLVETAEQVGAPIPRTWLVDRADDLQTASAEATFPVFLKLSDSHGGRGVSQCDTAEELMSAADEFSRRFDIAKRRLMVQEAAPGRDYCLTGLFLDGKFQAHMAYRNIRTMPGDGGFGLERETIDDAALVEAAAGLMRATGWTGVAELDYRWNGQRDSSPKLLEVNPRFWAGLFQSIESSVDYPWLLYEQTVTGGIAEQVSAELGVRTRAPLARLVSWICDFATDDDQFTALSEAWRSLPSRLAPGGIQQSLERMFGAEPGPPLARDDIEQRLVHGARAKSELFSSEDPLAALGVLYVVGSLIRHGELPEEFHRSDDRAPGEKP